MKKRIQIIILIFIAIACKEEGPKFDNGMITGQDLRLCACCGGWIINIDDVNYRFQTLPPMTKDIDLYNSTYPIYVQLAWKPVKNPCLGDEIKVSYMREIKTR